MKTGIVLAIVVTVGILTPHATGAEDETAAVALLARTATGTAPTDLTRDDLEVLVDGHARPIVSVAPDRRPVTMAFLFERGALNGAGALAVAELLGASLGPQDRASISSTTQPGLPLVRAPADLRKEIVVGYGKPLSVWDSLDATIATLGRDDDTRKVVIALVGQPKPARAPLPSTSTPLYDPVTHAYQPPYVEDVPPRATSKLTQADVSKRAQRESVAMSVLACDGMEFDSHVRRLADDSGGAFAMLRAGADPSSTIARLLAEAHTFQVVRFTPASMDGKLHALEVRVKRPGVTVQAPRAFPARPSRRP